MESNPQAEGCSALPVLKTGSAYDSDRVSALHSDGLEDREGSFRSPRRFESLALRLKMDPCTEPGFPTGVRLLATAEVAQRLRLHPETVERAAFRPGRRRRRVLPRQGIAVFEFEHGSGILQAASPGPPPSG
jgi:hypothetical protein